MHPSQIQSVLKYRIAGKSDGEWNLVVWRSRLKLLILFSPATRNNVIHAALIDRELYLANVCPTQRLSTQAVHVASLTLARCQFYFLIINLRIHDCSVPQMRDGNAP